MSLKVLVIVLAAAVVAVVLVLFYAGVRPDGSIDAAQRDLDGAVGDLTSGPALTFGDVDRAACADAEIEGFIVPGQSTCRIAVESPARITLCAEAPSSVVIATDGVDYPAATMKASAIGCSEPQQISIYDRQTTVSITCLQATACAVRVLEPQG